jgi:hypothetical protein
MKPICEDCFQSDECRDAGRVEFCFEWFKIEYISETGDLR